MRRKLLYLTCLGLAGGVAAIVAAPERPEGLLLLCVSAVCLILDF